MVKKFKSRVKAEGSGLGWKILDIPFDVKKTFGKAGRIPVSGKVNGFPFRSSLFPRKVGPHFLLMNKQMQNGAEATSLGDLVNVEIEFDAAKRTVATPLILKRVLQEEEGLLEYFSGLNYSTRKWISESITQPKSPKAQQRRAEQIAVHIYEMMEGEKEPPPILQAVFASNPKAKAGWQMLPVSHKRSHLWGIFYYKGPAARQKRLEKAVKMIVEYAEKKGL